MRTPSPWLPLVVDAENALGLLPKQPAYRTRSVWIAQLKRRAEKDAKVTPANLRLALELAVRRRDRFTTPFQLVSRIDDALQLAADMKPVSELTQAVDDALSYEYGCSDPVSERWLLRLTRATGPARREVLAEWAGAGRG